MNDQLFQLMTDRFDKLENKVDDLMQWRWQIYGMTVLISAVLGLGVQVLIAYYQSKGSL